MKHPPLYFRGNRDYVLGADLLDAVLAEIHGSAPALDLDYVIKHPCRCQSFRLLPRERADQADAMLALGTLQDNDHDLLIMPHGPAVELRQPCDEHLLAETYTFTEQDGHPEVEVHLAPGGSLARNCVVAFKYLLNRYVVSEAQRYLFTRLRLENTSLPAFTLRFERKFAGRFYEGRILHQGQAAGSIYFNGGMA